MTVPTTGMREQPPASTLGLYSPSHAGTNNVFPPPPPTHHGNATGPLGNPCLSPAHPPPGRARPAFLCGASVTPRGSPRPPCRAGVATRHPNPLTGGVTRESSLPGCAVCGLGLLPAPGWHSYLDEASCRQGTMAQTTRVRRRTVCLSVGSWARCKTNLRGGRPGRSGCVKRDFPRVLGLTGRRERSLIVPESAGLGTAGASRERSALLAAAFP
jgi:hypothetical protein